MRGNGQVSGSIKISTQMSPNRARISSHVIGGISHG